MSERVGLLGSEDLAHKFELDSLPIEPPHDSTPRRLPDAVNKQWEQTARLRDMVGAYYAARGWDAAGQVPAALVEELGLTDL